VLSEAFLYLQFGFAIFCQKIIGAKDAHIILEKLTNRCFRWNSQWEALPRTNFPLARTSNPAEVPLIQLQ